MRFDEILGLLPRLSYRIDSHPGWWLFLLELLYWAVAILLTLALVRFRPAVLEKLEFRVREISKFKRFWLVAFGLLVIFLRLALLRFIPVPVPVVHDEFSYLLAADTFAHGRLTNPSSPMWVHFESFHINVRPTYQSMYPAAQGMVLALGQKLTGIPWTGVLLSTAIMCNAIYWMLLGWLPAPWAWLGGAFACARFGIFSYWMNSYWGGAVAAIGGALVLGAYARFRKQPTAQLGLIFAIGLLLLANSRPLEGFLFSLPLIISGGIVVLKEGRTDWRRMAQAVLPAIALLLIGVGWMLYYNWRGTGNALVMPYFLNFREYHISRPFLFQGSNPIPHYRHQALRTFYVWFEYLDVLKLKYAVWSFVTLKAGAYYGFFLWPFLLLAGPGVYAMWRSELRIALVSLGLLAADLLAQTWRPQPHYGAPGAGGLILLLLFSVRHFRKSQSAYTLWGSRAAALVMAIWLISPIADTLRDPWQIGPPLLRDPWQTSPASLQEQAMATPPPLQIERQRIQADLAARTGKQLIIVHYPPRDMPGQDWIYNDADIDHAKVIWARDMGYLSNQELLNYYPDRRVWYVDRADWFHMLLPYDQAMAPVKHAFEGPELETGSLEPRDVGTRERPTESRTARQTAAAMTAATPR